MIKFFIKWVSDISRHFHLRNELFLNSQNQLYVIILCDLNTIDLRQNLQMPPCLQFCLQLTHHRVICIWCKIKKRPARNLFQRISEIHVSCIIAFSFRERVPISMRAQNMIYVKMKRKWYHSPRIAVAHSYCFAFVTAIVSRACHIDRHRREFATFAS